MSFLFPWCSFENFDPQPLILTPTLSKNGEGGKGLKSRIRKKFIQFGLYQLCLIAPIWGVDIELIFFYFTITFSITSPTFTTYTPCVKGEVRSEECVVVPLNNFCPVML